LPLLSNAKLKSYRALKLSKYRERSQQFLIEGLKFCSEAFKAAIPIDAFLYCPEIVSAEIATRFIHRCQSNNIPCFEMTPAMLNELSDTVHSQGLLCVLPRLAIPTDFNSARLLVAVDALQEPGNLGTIIRTADWFGADGVLVGTGSVDIYNAKTLRASMGSIFHIPTLPANLDLLLPQLRQQGITTYAAVAHDGISLPTIRFAQRSVIVLGNESQGIREALQPFIDVLISIPGYGRAESLNVAIANGIILNQIAGNHDFRQ